MQTGQATPKNPKNEPNPALLATGVGQAVFLIAIKRPVKIDPIANNVMSAQEEGVIRKKKGFCNTAVIIPSVIKMVIALRPVKSHSFWEIFLIFSFKDT